MERVKKGKTYWWIRIYDGIEVCADMDWRKDFSTKNFNDGNYFHTREEAETTAEKIRNVLKGAIVIDKLPSEEEIKMHFHRVLIEDYLSCDRKKATFSEGCMKCYEWLKSKIVK